jgi:hypothetical protein
MRAIAGARWSGRMVFWNLKEAAFAASFFARMAGSYID